MCRGCARVSERVALALAQNTAGFAGNVSKSAPLDFGEDHRADIGGGMFK